jgi:ribose transport system substrate-binding protein
MKFVIRSGVILLCMMGIVGVFGCDQSTSTTVVSATKRMRIGISIPAADHGWTAGIFWWAKKAMALHPEVDWQIQTADTGQKQVADIEGMLATGIDGLVVLPQDVEPVTQICKKAHEQGVYIINVDRGLTQPVADILVEGDNKAFGRKSAEYIANRMNKKGNLVILEGKPCQVNSDRVDSAKAIFSLYPDIKIVADQPADWDHEKALSAMQAILAQNPHIDVVWTADDDMLMGAKQAIKEAGREKEMWLFGGAGMNIVVKMVMDNDPSVPADVTYPPSMIATGIHLAASNLAYGHKADLQQFMPRHLIQDVDLITPENAKDYYFPDSVY